MARLNLRARRSAALRRARRRLQRYRGTIAATGIKSSSVAGMAVEGTAGAGAWKGRTYENYAREAYVRNVIAFRAVNFIAASMGMLEWYVIENDEIVEDEKHDLVKLMARPNPRQGTSAFIEAVAAFRLLAGNSYIERVPAKSETPPDQIPRALELWTLRPDRTLPVYDPQTGKLEGYAYSSNGKDLEQFPINKKTNQADVLHWMTFNPLDGTIGQSPIAPAAFGVDQHNAGNEWNYHLLKNGARPLGIITHKSEQAGGELSEEERIRLKKQLAEKHQGSRNAGRFMLLEGYMEWQQMGMSPVEMDFTGGMDNAARQIAIAFGIAPMLLGIPGESTFANYAEARLAAWEDTILPLAKNLRGELNYWLAPGFGENVKLMIDEDQIPAIAHARLSQWTAVEGAHFVTVDEKREAVGYEELPDGQGDVVLVPAGLIPISLDEPDEPEDEPDVEELPDDLEEDPAKAGEIAYGRKR